MLPSLPHLQTQEVRSIILIMLLHHSVVKSLIVGWTIKKIMRTQHVMMGQRKVLQPVPLVTTAIMFLSLMMFLAQMILILP